MRNLESYNDDELVEIGLLAVQYIQANQAETEYRIKTTVGKFSELMKLVGLTKQAHSDLEMAILSGGQK